MKRAWLALVMLVPLFAGCLSTADDDPNEGREAAPVNPGYNAEELRIADVTTHDLTIMSGDVELSAILYEPLTTDAIRGEVAVWPLVVLVHPWGFPKETYENAPLATEGQAGPPQNIMQMFAESGLMTISFDTRGWGQSGGESTVAGEKEMRDLRNVIDYVNDNFPTNGLVGVAGNSYGGAHAYLAWQRFDDVVTAAPHNGWVDLYEGVFPGHVPKLEWGAALVGIGSTGFGGRLSPEVYDWVSQSIVRQTPEDMAPIEAQLDSRSLLASGAAATNKPLLVCQAIHDSLFGEQAHLAWQNAPGFTRAVYYLGGHNTLDEECWDKTRDWFLFFLAGIDTKVDEWNYLDAVDAADNGPRRSYSELMAGETDDVVLYLREGQLVEYVDAGRTFNIAQRMAANPLSEPSVAWESTGQPYQPVPEQFRQDPTGLFFESAPFGKTGTLLGAPHVDLYLAEGAETPFQIVATLYHKQDGSLRLLARSATGPLGVDHLEGNTTSIELAWLKLDVHPDDQLVLKLASNDPAVFAPLYANYDVPFTGESRLTLAQFAPPALGG